MQVMQHSVLGYGFYRSKKRTQASMQRKQEIMLHVAWYVLDLSVAVSILLDLGCKIQNAGIEADLYTCCIVYGAYGSVV